MLVEDDADVMKTNAKILGWEGYEVLQAETAREAFETVLEDNPDLIVLDILLPDRDGIELCRKIREVSSAPVLFLTCLGESADRVRGLNAGGDDYLSKPYDMDEFCARVGALLRRSRRTPREMLAWPPLSIDLALHRAWLDGEDALLTPMEFRLLVLLAQNIGRPLSGEELFEKLWTQPVPGDGRNEALHTIQVHVSALRRKLRMTEESAVQIRTIRNRGYCFIYDRRA